MPRSFRFVPPEPRPDSLIRPRLLRSLVGRWDHRVTSITGGPGLGKTTLLAQAIAENRLAPRGQDIWIGVEPLDADADRLAHVVASAVDSAADGADGPRVADRNGSLDPNVLADAVWQRAPAEACLVFDDAHLIPADSAGAAWLRALVEALPDNGHVVLSSRAGPPIPLSRIGTQGAVLMLAEDDLRFSDEELTGFAAQRGLDRAQFATTGGWPAMAALAASIGQQFTGDYLWEEVLAPLGTVRRHVLSVLCDLDGADDELASAAVGTSIDLDQSLRGVPLVARGADGWYVPHALWRTAPGLDLGATERADIRRRAAENLTHRGRFDEAFRLLQDAELWDAAPAVLRAACLASDRLFSSQLGRWISTSSDAVRESSAGQLASGLHQAFTTPDLAVEALQRAAAMCRAENDVDGEVTAIAQLGRLAWWRQDLPGLMSLGARVSELEATGHPKARALTSIARAMLADINGDDAEIVRQLNSIESGVLDPAWEVLASGLYVSARLDQGETQPTYDLVARFGPTADPVLRGVLEVLDLSARWAEGHVDEVLERIPATWAAVTATGVRWLLYLGYSGGTNAYARSGHTPEARSWLSEMLANSPPGDDEHPSGRTALTTASVLLAEGDEAAAAAVIRDAFQRERMDRGGDRRMWRQNIDLSYVLVPETRKEWDAAPLIGHLLVTRQLAQAVVALREGDGVGLLRTLDVSDIGLVRSSLHFRFGAELAVGLAEIGRPEGRILLEHLGQPGRETVRALSAALQPTRLAGHARSLLAAVPAPPPQSPTYLGVLGPLTLRRGERDGPPVTDPNLRRKRLQSLLAFLIKHRTTRRGAITAALWPDLDERSAGNNLGVTLNHLMRLLEPWRDSGEPAYLLRVDGPSVQLVADEHLRVDADEFADHLAAAARAEADGTPSLALEHNLAAVELYRDDLFVEIDEEEWLVLDREHYRTRFVRSAVRAGQLLLARGDADRAQLVAHRALGADPWSEDAYAVLISSSLAAGDRSAARRLLTRCEEALADLGVGPSPATLQLRRRVVS